MNSPFRPLRWFVPLSVAFFAVYLLLDLREGGRSQSLTTTEIVSPARYVELFGLPYVVGMIVANVVLALLAAALVTTAINAYRARRSGAAPACSAGASVVLGFAVFGCPGCLVPLFGTLGLTAFATSLPLFGIELKAITAALMLGALLWTRRRATTRSAADRELQSA